MTRKKKTIIWIVVIVVLVGGFLALRIPSWTRTYGLSEDVIAGKIEPTAEEVIRLSFYYAQHNNYEADKRLYTEQEAVDGDFFARWTYLIHWLLDDVKLLEVEYGNTYDGEEWDGAYQIKRYEIKYNEGFLWTSSKENKETQYYDRVILVQKEKGAPWQIDDIGNG